MAQKIHLLQKLSIVLVVRAVPAPILTPHPHMTMAPYLNKLQVLPRHHNEETVGFQRIPEASKNSCLKKEFVNF